MTNSFGIHDDTNDTLRALIGIINSTGPFRAERSGAKRIDVYLPNTDEIYVLTIEHENEPAAQGG